MPWLPVNDSETLTFDIVSPGEFIASFGSLSPHNEQDKAARDWCIRAKRAEEIQLRRGWSVDRWSGGKWHLAEYSCEDSFHADWNENGFDTPIDCLVANDEWFVAYEAEGLT